MIRSLVSGPKGRERLMVAGLAAMALGILFWVQVRGAESRLNSTAFSLETASAGPVLEHELACVESIRMRRGQTLSEALADAGVDPGSRVSMLSHLWEWVDPRRIRPEDRMTLYKTPSGKIQRFEYQRRPEEWVLVELAGAGYRGEMVQEPVEFLLRKIEGEVRDNLSVSMDNAGGSAALTINFTELFAWDFDFATDTRNGDRFQVLAMEKRIAGERVSLARIIGGTYQPVGASEPMQVYHYSWNDGAEEGYYDEEGRSIKKFFLKSPLNFRRISSHFTHKRFHPILKKYRPHLGIDYAAPMGTPVVALGNGKVALAGWRKGYGRTIQIKHNRTYMTQYAHLSRYAKGIRSGARVKQGQVIGYVGSTGLSTGPHLDFRVQENGRWINPLRLDGGKSEPLPSAQAESFAATLSEIRELFARIPAGSAVALPAEGEDRPLVAGLRLDTPFPS